MSGLTIENLGLKQRVNRMEYDLQVLRTEKEGLAIQVRSKLPFFDSQ